MVSTLVLVYVWCMTSTKDNKGTQQSSTLNNSGSDQTILQKKCESEHSIDNEGVCEGMKKWLIPWDSIFFLKAMNSPHHQNKRKWLVFENIFQLTI